VARHDGRQFNELRPIRLIKSPQRDPAGSVLIEWGNTKVICSASLEEKTPPWMSQSDGRGWITAEYSMLPGSSDRRIHRDRARNNGRTHEIQRLIGRSLRTCVDLRSIGPRTLYFDCDVIQADGGTRVASITGSYLALCIALKKMLDRKLIKTMPKITQIAAVSTGKIGGEILTDLDYKEDSSAEVDANVVMNENLEFIELQGTAEKASFSKKELDQVLEHATQACERIFQIQNQTLKEWEVLS